MSYYESRLQEAEMQRLSDALANIGPAHAAVRGEAFDTSDAPIGVTVTGPVAWTSPVWRSKDGRGALEMVFICETCGTELEEVGSGAFCPTCSDLEF